MRTSAPDRHDDVVRRLARACQLGDAGALRAALDTDVVAVCDSGGLVPAALAPLHGVTDVAQLLAALCEPPAELTIEAVNGRTGLALRRDGRALAVISVQVAATRIDRLWIVLTPAKLGGWHDR